MADDEIKIIRQVRHEISAECGHDVDRVVDYYRSVEEELKRSGRFRFAGCAARPESRQEAIGGRRSHTTTTSKRLSGFQFDFQLGGRTFGEPDVARLRLVS